MIGKKLDAGKMFDKMNKDITKILIEFHTSRKDINEQLPITRHKMHKVILNTLDRIHLYAKREKSKVRKTREEK